jgi:hypothetical protein
MTRVVIERVVSDLSGEEIPDGKVWTMTLTPPDGRRNPVRLDISESEAQQWLSRGTEVKRRGRRPGTVTARKAKSLPANGRRRGRKTQSASANGRRRKVAVNGRRKRRAARS